MPRISFSDPFVLLESLNFKTTLGASNNRQNIYRSKKLSGPSEAAMALAKKGNENLTCYDPHTCCICKIVFSSRYALRSHIDVKHCKTKKMFCDLCPKEYFSRTKMIVHMTVHCRRSFDCKNIQSSRFHKLTHAAKTPCPICKKEVSSMKNHMETHPPMRGQAAGMLIDTFLLVKETLPHVVV